MLSSLSDVASERREAGRRLSRRILTTCWSSFLSHLLSCLGPYLVHRGDSSGKSGLAGLFRRGAKDGRKNTKLGLNDDILSRGVECLQASVMLCSELELHDRCGEMLEPLTCLICPDLLGERPSTSLTKKQQRHKNAANKRYGLVNLVCVEDILRNGFELASQSQDCWKYVMRCVTQVLHMESERSGRDGGDNAMAAKKGAAEARKRGRNRKGSEDDDLDLCFNNDDDGLEDDVDETM